MSTSVCTPKSLADICLPVVARTQTRQTTKKVLPDDVFQKVEDFSNLEVSDSFPSDLMLRMDLIDFKERWERSYTRKEVKNTFDSKRVRQLFQLLKMPGGHGSSMEFMDYRLMHYLNLFCHCATCVSCQTCFRFCTCDQ